MEAELDLSVLDAITDAVESGAGLHEVVRAASRALDASLVLTDRGGGTVAVTVLVMRAHSLAPAGDGWRTRALEVADRGARAVVPGALAAQAELTATSGAEVVLILPGDDEPAARRAAESVLRELQAGLPGHGFAVGRSRVATSAGDLHRGASEALL